jgi:hypothetical protein
MELQTFKENASVKNLGAVRRFEEMMNGYRGAKAKGTQPFATRSNAINRATNPGKSVSLIMFGPSEGALSGS